MPDLKVNVSYTLTLTPAEFRLVSSALRAAGGFGPFRAEHATAAAELQQRLFELRDQKVGNFADTIERMTPEPVAPRRDCCPHCGRTSAGASTNLCIDAYAGRDCKGKRGAA